MTQREKTRCIRIDVRNCKYFSAKCRTLAERWIMFENGLHTVSIFIVLNHGRGIQNYEEFANPANTGMGEKFAKVSGKAWTNKGNMAICK